MEDIIVISLSHIVYFISKIFLKDFEINKIEGVSLLDLKLNEQFYKLLLPSKILIFVLKYIPYLLFISILYDFIFKEVFFIGDAITIVRLTLISYTLYYLFFIRKNLKDFLRTYVKILGSWGRMTEVFFNIFLK